MSQFWGAGGSLPGSIREGGEGGCHIKPALGENGVQGERGGLRMELEPPHHPYPGCRGYTGTRKQWGGGHWVVPWVLDLPPWDKLGSLIAAPHP